MRAGPFPARWPPRNTSSLLLLPGTSWQQPATGDCQEGVLLVEAISHGGASGGSPPELHPAMWIIAPASRGPAPRVVGPANSEPDRPAALAPASRASSCRRRAAARWPDWCGSWCLLDLSGQASRLTVGQASPSLSARPVGAARPVGSLSARPAGSLSARPAGSLSARPAGSLSARPAGSLAARPIGSLSARRVPA